MGDVIEFEITGGYIPTETAKDEMMYLRDELRKNERLKQYLERMAEKQRKSNASLAAGHCRIQLEIQSLQKENATLREQVTQGQALAFQLKREIGALRLALREFGVEL